MLPARIFHGVGGAIDLGESGVRIGADVENLFDLRVLAVRSALLGSIEEPVSDFIGYPLPGRTVWISARFSRDQKAR